MRCPRCGNEQSDGWLSCQKCHIIFSRWQPDPAPTPQRRAPSAPPPPDDAPSPKPPTLYGDRPAGPPPAHGPVPAAEAAGSQPGWPVFLALLLGLAAGLWWVLHPRGRASEPGSFRDAQAQFAIHAPDGWVALTRGNIQSILEQVGEQLPAQVTRALASPAMAVSIVRLGPPGEFAPSLNVMVVRGTPPPINERSKREAAKAIADGFNAMLAGYRQESGAIVAVDGIRSLEIVSTSASPMRPAADEGNSPSTLRYRQLLVPGKKRMFIVTCTGAADDDGPRADFQRALDSFRVLQRPPRFGPVLNGGIIGGLVGGLLYALAGLFHALEDRRRD